MPLGPFLPPRPEEEQIRNSEFYKMYLEEKNGLGGNFSATFFFRSQPTNLSSSFLILTSFQWPSKELENQSIKPWRVMRSWIWRSPRTKDPNTTHSWTSSSIFEIPRTTTAQEQQT